MKPHSIQEPHGIAVKWSDKSNSWLSVCARMSLRRQGVWIASFLSSLWCEYKKERDIQRECESRSAVLACFSPAWRLGAKADTLIPIQQDMCLHVLQHPVIPPNVAAGCSFTRVICHWIIFLLLKTRTLIWDIWVLHFETRLRKFHFNHLPLLRLSERPGAAICPRQ